jgi:hypothetical protein
MVGRILIYLLVLIAVLMGILASVAGNLSDHWINIIGIIARFFDVTLPILGVAALLKYLCCCPHHHGNDEIKR